MRPTTLIAVNQLAASLFKRECSDSPSMPVFMAAVAISTDIHRNGSELSSGVRMASRDTYSPHRTGLRSTGEEVLVVEAVPFHGKMN